MDTNPPSLQGFGFITGIATPGGIVEAWVSVSDNVGLDSIYAELFAGNYSSSDTVLISTATTTVTGVLDTNVTLTFSLNALDPASSFDFVFINYILLTDLNSNSAPYYDGVNMSSPRIPVGFGANAPMLAGIGATSDTVAPGTNLTFWIELDSTNNLSSFNISYIEATVIERRTTINITSIISHSYQNGSRYYFIYLVESDTPLNTTIMFSEISIYYAEGIITFLDGIDFESPVIVVNTRISPPIEEKIEMFVSPDTIYSFVNETIAVNVTVISHFMHSMSNVSFTLTELNGNTTLYSSKFDLPANSSVSFSAEISFEVAGTYRVVGTLFDDEGSAWSYTFEAYIREQSNDLSTNSTTTGNPKEDTPVNTTSSGTELNSPQISGLFAPGFTFFIATFGISVIVIFRKKS